MTYPPPGGENPQYQLQPEPQPPTDPYMQGYNTTPPPGNYYQQQPPQPQYTQPGPPMMSPQVGVQQGYPSAPGSVLPPPLPPARQGGSLGVILAVVIGLVLVLGVAAVLIIPGLGDDEPDAKGGDEDKTTAAEEPSSEPVEEETTEEEDTGGTVDDDFATWGTPVNSDSFDANTPEGAALTYRLAADSDDNAALESVVCASPTDSMEFDRDWELENEGWGFGFLLWSMSREVSGGTEVWVGWTMDDSAPESQADVDGGSGYTFTAVEEGGQWKLCDVEY